MRCGAPAAHDVSHLVKRMLQSYEYTSRNRCESRWTFSMHHADELLSPNVCKNDLGSCPILVNQYIDGLFRLTL